MYGHAGFTSRQIMHLSDVCEHIHPIDRSITLLRCGFPKKSVDDIISWPLGEKNWRLFYLRQATFGNDLQAKVTCNHCRQEFVISLQCHNFLEARSDDFNAYYKEFESDSENIRFRLPIISDLIQSTSINDDTDLDHLLKCCVLEGDTTSITDTFNYIEKYDPLLNIIINAACLACEANVSALMDIGTFFWKEICLYAREIIEEVGILARYFSWSESDILNMGTNRRHRYLAMVQQ